MALQKEQIEGIQSTLSFYLNPSRRRRGSQIHESEIRYVEPRFETAMGLKYFVDGLLTAKGRDLIYLVVRIGTEIGQELAPASPQ